MTSRIFFRFLRPNPPIVNLCHFSTNQTLPSLLVDVIFFDKRLPLFKIQESKNARFSKFCSSFRIKIIFFVFPETLLAYIPVFFVHKYTSLALCFGRVKKDVFSTRVGRRTRHIFDFLMKNVRGVVSVFQGCLLDFRCKIINFGCFSHYDNRGGY